MSLGDFFNQIKDGGPSVIFILAIGMALLITGQLRTKREVDDRDTTIARQETLLERAATQAEKQQGLFDQALEQQKQLSDQALGFIREELMSRLRNENKA